MPTRTGPSPVAAPRHGMSGTGQDARGAAPPAAARRPGTHDLRFRLNNKFDLCHASLVSPGSAGQPDARAVQFSVSARYPAASSRASTAAGSSGAISTSQPAAYGSALISSGSSVSVALRDTTVPAMGA